MKAVQPKTAEPASGAQSSFFKKGGDASLNNEQPFFTKNNSTPAVQTKLTVGQPNDKYEQEADSVANQVVQRMSSPGNIQAKAMDGEKEEKVQRKEEEKEPVVQRKCAGCEKEEAVQKKGTDGTAPAGIENQLASKQGKGSPL